MMAFGMYIRFVLVLSSFSSTICAIEPGDEVKAPVQRDTYVQRTWDTRVLSEWQQILSSYSRYVRPNYTGAPTMVSVEVSVLSFGKINERDMTFTVDLFLRQRWSDYRLRHNLSTPITPMLGKKSPADIIWVPDSVFINSMDSKKHYVTVNNDKLDITKDGNVLWGTRVTLIYSCAMRFHSYPLDIQHCGIGIQSYAYSTRHIRYKWNKNPLGGEPVIIVNTQTPQFDIYELRHNEKTSQFKLGNFSVVNCQFEFKRKLSVSIIQIFIPTISIVSVSWMSFFFHKNSVSPRVTVLLKLSRDS